MTVALRPFTRVPWEVPVLVLIKLVVHPLLALLLLTAFGPFDPEWVKTAVLMAALPPALNVFVLGRQYEAWVEMLPRASRPVPLRVHAGDSVTASISEQATDQWLIEFSNNTTGQTYQQTQQYSSSHSSAEWVEEAPSGGRGGVLPLSNFGTIQFSDGSTVKDGQTVSIAATGARAITMVSNNDQALAVPSSLSDDGTSFTVARTDAISTTPGRGRRVPPPAN